MIGPLRPALVAMLAGMSIILLIACANVAALVMGQLEGRAGELAVRTALGADRGRLTMQLAAEVLVIGAAAGAIGAALGATAFGTLRSALPLGAWSARASLDWTLFATAMASGVLAALATAVIPSVTLWRGTLRSPLAGARTGGILRRRSAPDAMIVGEIALAVVLACFAGLLARSVEKLYDIRPGFATDNAVVLDVAAPTGSSDVDRLRMLRVATDRLAALPGVASVGVTQVLPLRSGGYTMGFQSPDAPANATTPFFRMVSRGYFAALGVRITRGRGFASTDRPTDSVKSIVINETLAAIYFPHRDPIGQTVRGGFGVRERVVGVVANLPRGV
jgi:hypothetical protein